VGHITQLCVTPEHLRKGLGRRLLTYCAAQLARRRFDAITLTVTAENAAAVGLYEKLGFGVRHVFDALVWTAASQKA
jgi:ribosomal protein S18 acetylase RimI-like enzyme